MAVTADNIIQRILLEGEAAITASLQKLGTVGERTFAGIGAAAERSNRILSSIGQHIQRSGAALNTFGRSVVNVFERGVTAISNFAGNVTQLARRMLTLKAAVGVAVTAILALVKGAADAADKINETSEALGISAKQFQELSGGAAQAGLDQDQLTKAVAFFTRQIEESSKETRGFNQQAADLGEQFRRTQSDIYRTFQTGADGVEKFGEAIDTVARDKALADANRNFQRSMQDLNKDVARSENMFRRYNITIARTADGNIDTVKTMQNVAQVIQRLGPGFEATQLAMQTFGTRNLKMINVVAQGAEGFRKFEEEGERLGTTVNKMTLAIGAELSDAFDKLNFVIKQNRISVLAPLFQPLTRFIDALTETIGRNRIAWQIWVQMVAEQVEPVIEDLIALLEGREEDVKLQWIVDAKNSIIEFGKAAGQAFTILIGIFKGLIFVLDGVAVAFNAVFGTDISGKTILLTAIFLKLAGVLPLVIAGFTLLVNGFIALGTLVGGVTLALGILVGLITFVLVKALMAVDWVAWWNKAKEAINIVIEAFKSAGAILVASWNAVIQWVIDKFNGFVQAVIDGFKWVGDTIKEAWNGIFAWFTDKIDKLIGWFSRLIAKAREFFGMKDKMDEGAAVSRARGGPIYGPGTETSDSILARLSRGEYVLNAKAVRRYGLRMLQAMNSMRMPRGAFAGFNAGGLIEPLRATMPRPLRMAQGGTVSGASRTVNLTIDGTEFPGFVAPENVADNLVRFATTRAVRSAGRRPNWYGGRK